MLFSVFTLDNPDAADKRRIVHGAHIAHLKSAKDYGVTITVGGPLVSDDGANPIGSLMVLEAPDRASAERFNRADPFHQNGVLGKIEIRRFDRKERLQPDKFLDRREKLFRLLKRRAMAA